MEDKPIEPNDFLAMIFQCSTLIDVDEGDFAISMIPILGSMAFYKPGSQKNEVGNRDEDRFLTKAGMAYLDKKKIFDFLTKTEIAFILFAVRKETIRICGKIENLRKVVLDCDDKKLKAMLDLHNKDGWRTEEIEMVYDLRDLVCEKLTNNTFDFGCEVDENANANNVATSVATARQATSNQILRDVPLDPDDTFQPPASVVDEVAAI
ncbi:MAG: hypothetical protein ACREOZ_00920 [Gloeomargaritales cyanobacterium]